MKIKTNRTTILPVFYRGAKLSSRKEHTPRVFENRVLTKMFGLKSDGVARDWMRLCEELYNLNCSTNIIREITSRKTRSERHVTRIGESKSPCSVLAARSERNYHLEDLCAGGRIILKSFARK
jgi:hypothetical protein